MKKAVVFLALILSSSCLLSQNLVPSGQFLEDSIEIGRPVVYSLTLSYPVTSEVIFPDSNYNYAPFEYVDKSYFTSQSDSTTITDSVHYQLTTFEIETVQTVGLPVFLVQQGDSAVFYAEPDSIYLKEMITLLPDSLALKEDTALLDVNKAFNYPYLLIGLGGLVVILGAVYLLFGKTISQKIALYRMARAYKKFTDDFDDLFGRLRKKGDRQVTERLLVVWKKYMEKLEDRPYTKLTSKEIAQLRDAKHFGEVLKTIDRSIYGQADMAVVFKNFETLEDITVKRYRKKVEEVRNG